MTQFALFRGLSSPPSFLRQLKTPDETYLFTIGKIVFDGRGGPFWLIDVEGDDIDAIAVEAQRDLCDGVVFENTRLFELVRSAASWSSDCAFWYAEDYGDLDIVNQFEPLIELIRDAVAPNTSCEIYARYHVART